MNKYLLVILACAVPAPAQELPSLRSSSRLAESFDYVGFAGIKAGVEAGPAIAGRSAVSPFLLLMSTRPYEAILEESKARVTAAWSLGEAEGVFKKFSVTASIDKDDLSRTRIDVVVDTRSAQSQNWYLSHKTLRAKLQADKFPAATMRTLGVKATRAPNVFEIEAEIDVMGQVLNKTITAVVAHEKDGKIRAAGSFEMTIGGDTGRMHFDLLLKPGK